MAQGASGGWVGVSPWEAAQPLWSPTVRVLARIRDQLTAAELSGTACNRYVDNESHLTDEVLAPIRARITPGTGCD